MQGNIIYALITVPLVVMISLAVFQDFSFNSRTSFETAVADESLGTGADTYTTAYPVKSGTDSVENGEVAFTNYTIDYHDGLDPATVVIGADGTGAITISYTAYDTANGYDEWEKVYDGTMNGFSLGTMLPFILIAIAVVGVVIGAFKFGKM